MMRELNGDDRLGIIERFTYLWRNQARNLAGAFAPVTFRPWRLPPFINLDVFSPGRGLTEAFILHQLPNLLKLAEVSVLDIGCGSGRASAMLAGVGYRGRYTGIDTDNRFDAVRLSGGSFETRFIQGDAHEVMDAQDVAEHGSYDLIISISALEHIHDDEQLIKRFDKMLTPGGIQVHFLPAPAGLWLYLWHGYRQYGARAIAERFGSEGVEVYRLGGLASFLLHLIVITLPEIFLGLSPRRYFPAWYRFKLGLCFRLDAAMPIFPAVHVVCQTRTKTRTES